ncbi:type II toxin-antitoxin system HicA family toxin [Microcystis sp. M113S1]|uniref:type II toxin-antitoxin system HicA family toxin n=1 Tax=Microcystis sp. M113S1 TaxID=2771104 RepID=UPI00258E23F2|nr:type II toxin-antitoxin system HicA family toxin [Microcystis sp. M113S1]
MPKKIRELKSILLKAGFTYRHGKGSHTVWSNPREDNIVISKAPFLEEVFQEIKQIISCFREKSPNTPTVMLKKSLSGNREQFLMP